MNPIGIYIMKQELKQQFIDALYEVYPDCQVHGTVTRKQIDDVMQKKGITILA